jgi:hypothetical protein
VVGAGLNLALVSLTAATVAGLLFVGHQVLVLRDIAVTASRFGALAEVQPGQAERYALELMQESLPLLQAGAKAELSDSLLGLTLTATVPVLASSPLAMSARAEASRERFRSQ